MGLWQQYLSGRERVLAAASDPLKTAGDAAVGLDLLDPGCARDDLPALLRHGQDALADVDGYFARTASPNFRRAGSLLLFDSPAGEDGPNSVARARLFSARTRERAVVLLPFWNASRASLASFGHLLAGCGVSCLQLSLPYHDERQTPGAGFARELVCENLGLTMRSNRQAVRDARAGLDWLEAEGYRRLGIVGMSIGSSVGSLVAALDERVRAAALILMADDFAEVVWTGTSTRHVRRSLERTFTREEVRAAWSIISPATYAARLSRRLRHLLIVSGALDTVFLPETTQAYVDRLRGSGLDADWARYACGHHTLALPPYAARTVVRTVMHLRKNL